LGLNGKKPGILIREAIILVQGISKQVIVLQPKDEDVFEQAIFILKQDALAKGGVTDAVLMKQARQATGSRCMNNSRSWLKYLIGGVIGTAITCAAWAAIILF
jgi:hypothetical protein